MVKNHTLERINADPIPYQFATQKQSKAEEENLKSYNTSKKAKNTVCLAQDAAPSIKLPRQNQDEDYIDLMQNAKSSDTIFQYPETDPVEDHEICCLSEEEFNYSINSTDLKKKDF